MKDQQLEKKVSQDVIKVKEDLSTLVDDGAAGVGRIEDDVSQAVDKAKKDMTAWVKDGVSQLSKGFEKLTVDARETVVGAATTVKKDVGQGLIQYNDKAQEVANKVPGGFGKKAASYPWVAISIALVVGFLLGGLLKPTHQTQG